MLQKASPAFCIGSCDSTTYAVSVYRCTNLSRPLEYTELPFWSKSGDLQVKKENLKGLPRPMTLSYFQGHKSLRKSRRPVDSYLALSSHNPQDTKIFSREVWRYVRSLLSRAKIGLFEPKSLQKGSMHCSVKPITGEPSPVRWHVRRECIVVGRSS